MFLSYRDGLSFYRQTHKYRMRRGLVEGLTEESPGWGWGGKGRRTHTALPPTPWVAGGSGGCHISLRLSFFTCKVVSAAQGYCEDSGTCGPKRVSSVPGTACAKAQGREQRREETVAPGPDHKVPGPRGSKRPRQLGGHAPLCAVASSFVRGRHRGSHFIGVSCGLMTMPAT